MMLSGKIPSDIENCLELVGFYLYDNSLLGSLQRELGMLPKLQKLILWQNNSVRSIPQKIGKLDQFRRLLKLTHQNNSKIFSQPQEPRSLKEATTSTGQFHRNSGSWLRSKSYLRRITSLKEAFRMNDPVARASKLWIFLETLSHAMVGFSPKNGIYSKTRVIWYFEGGNFCVFLGRSVRIVD